MFSLGFHNVQMDGAFGLDSSASLMGTESVWHGSGHDADYSSLVTALQNELWRKTMQVESLQSQLEMKDLQLQHLSSELHDVQAELLRKLSCTRFNTSSRMLGVSL